MQVQCFTKAKEALKSINIFKPDIIVTDYIMPEMNGLEFIKELRKFDSKIPIILITASRGESIKMRALELGATEYLCAPVDRAEFIVRVKNLLELIKYQKLVENKVMLLNSEVEKAVKTIEKRERETLEVLVRTAKKKDADTGNHIIRVAHYTKIIAKKIGMSEREQKEIFYGAKLHDIGKVGIHDEILNKPGKLTKEEFEVMKSHTFIGYDILKDKDSEYLRKGAVISLSHHERYDGTGYPNAIKGEDIPIEGRIVAIADVFDALMMKRSYKNTWDILEAINYIKEASGKQFDPYLVDIFLKNIFEIKEIYNNFKD